MAKSQSPRLSKGTSRVRIAALATFPVLAAIAMPGEYYHLSFCGGAVAGLAVLCILLDRASQQRSELNAIDCAVLLLAVFEVVSLAMSQYRPNSLYWTGGLFFEAVVYCLVRLSLRTRGHVIAFSSIIAVFGVWLSLSALSRFSERFAKLNAAGFAGIVPFREKLTMASGNVVAGEWFTVVLLTVPYALLPSALAFFAGRRVLGALATLPVVVNALELTATCSRAVFAALVVGLVALAVLALGRRRRGAAL